MRHGIRLLAGLLLFACCASSSADTLPEDMVTLTGVLGALYDANDVLNGYTLTTADKTTYMLQVNAEQTADLNPHLGKMLNITGTLHGDDTLKVLIVMSFSAVVQAPDATPNPVEPGLLLSDASP